MQYNDLPVSIAAMFELLGQTDYGDYLIGNLRFWGGCAANLLGRFAYGDDRILDLVNQITEHEKMAFNDFVVAEIAHVPQSRTGNILSRPHIREYEILYLANSQIDNANQIPVNDLMVSVRSGKVRLRSVRLNKGIIPRLTTAHNYSGTDTSPIYRFLCDLQHQHGRSSLAFRWGALSNVEHLPRVMYRNIIFSQEQWILRCDQFPFKKGDVMTVSDVVKFAAVSKQNGDLDISVVALEEADSKVELEIPEFKQVTISVTNEGATLTINGDVVDGQEWSDQVEKGKSVTYKAELEGYTTQEDTLTVGDEDITEEITLVEA